MAPEKETRKTEKMAKKGTMACHTMSAKIRTYDPVDLIVVCARCGIALA